MFVETKKSLNFGTLKRTLVLRQFVLLSSLYPMRHDRHGMCHKVIDLHTVSTIYIYVTRKEERKYKMTESRQESCSSVDKEEPSQNKNETTKKIATERKDTKEKIEELEKEREQLEKEKEEVNKISFKKLLIEIKEYREHFNWTDVFLGLFLGLIPVALDQGTDFNFAATQREIRINQYHS